jgi:glycosyltransferase involved in cell wall biosynthesis
MTLISVCMAVYNGERFLEEQLQSILDQLGDDDEVIIVDDRSTDRSMDLIKNMADPRLVLLSNESNIGPIASFERAITVSKGTHIFLSDQDDIWRSNKVKRTLQVFASTNCLLVVSDARVVDAERRILNESLFSLRRSGPGFWRNLYKNGFVGCCMTIRSDSKELFLPFPRQISMYDEWIGLCTTVAGRVHFMDDALVDYRRHRKNVTKMTHGSIGSMVGKRVIFFQLILMRIPRILRWRFQMAARKYRQNDENQIR